ncbi:glycosyltransferase family 4 protein [Cupriavidus sp. L7L]|uniref:glycosyltransferase family 4 protein n=1 Tax=Cupriavidus sp. L7L TaxID=2546443 RepID=UPI00269735F3
MPGAPDAPARQPDKQQLNGTHVAFVANSSWSIQQYRSGVVRALLARGARVSIIAPPDRASESLQALGCEFHPLTLSARSANPLADWKCFSQLAKLYRQLEPDCVFQYTIKPNIYGSFAARLSRIPCFAVTTGLGFVFINDNLVARIGRALYRVALRSAKQVWFLNRDDLQEFLARNLVREQQTFVLPSEGIDLDHYAPGESQDREDGVFRFLLVARMLWDKGIGEYVEAARRIREEHPHVRFQLLGPADVENPSAISRTQLLAWQDRGLIEYLGSAADVRSAMANADCVVLPSYREGVPRTLLEAASMAKPIVATDVPGCRDVVRDGLTGRLCRARNADELTAALLAMCRCSRDTLQKMGQAGRLDVGSRFGEAQIVDIYLETISRLHNAIGR